MLSLKNNIIMVEKNLSKHIKVTLAILILGAIVLVLKSRSKAYIYNTLSTIMILNIF